MKRDMTARLFLLCQITGFMCNYKSVNNRRSQRLKTILSIRTNINKKAFSKNNVFIIIVKIYKLSMALNSLL